MAEMDELVARAKAGDQDALNRLMELFRDYIRRHLAHRWYPPRYDPVEEAEDLTQRTFMKLERALEGYSERGKFRAWLRRVAEYQHKMWVRRVIKVELDTLHTSAGADPTSAATLFPTGKNFLRQALPELSPGEREAWDLYAQGLSGPEIAARLGRKPNAINVRLKRARDRLSDLITSMYLGGSEDGRIGSGPAAGRVAPPQS